MNSYTILPHHLLASLGDLFGDGEPVTAQVNNSDRWNMVHVYPVPFGKLT